MSNLPIKKPDIPEVIVPMLSQLLQGAMPTQIPQMLPDSGFFQDWRGNWKRKRMNKAAKLEAEIAEYKERYTKASLNAIYEFMTFN